VILKQYVSNSILTSGKITIKYLHVGGKVGNNMVDAVAGSFLFSAIRNCILSFSGKDVGGTAIIFVETYGISRKYT